MEIKGNIVFPLKVDRSRIHGKGVYSGGSIPAKRKIGSLGGRVISKKEGRIRARSKRTISLVELWNGKTLDASVNSNALRYVNHSCKPNTFMRTIGFHVEFYALTNIAPREELTCNYGITHHEGSLKCNCGVEGCLGFL